MKSYYLLVALAAGLAALAVATQLPESVEGPADPHVAEPDVEMEAWFI